jgi:hypothetical protein
MEIVRGRARYLRSADEDDLDAIRRIDSEGIEDRIPAFQKQDGAIAPWTSS